MPSLNNSDTRILVDLLRRCDMHTLSDILGPSVLAVIKEVHSVGVEGKMAETILLKLGSKALQNIKLRMSLIDVFPLQIIDDFAEALGREFSSPIEAVSELTKYFKSWNEKTSSVFLRVLGLSNALEFRSQKDTRLPCELVKVEYGHEIVSTGQLHGYQSTVRHQLNKALLHSKDQKAVMVQMPTGAGKTFTALESVVDILRLNSHNTFVVWIVESNELAHQAFNSFKKIWAQKGDREIGLYRFHNGIVPEQLESDSGVAFCSFSTTNSVLAKDNHKGEVALKTILESTHTIIVDEAHSSMAETYEECLDVLKKLSNPNLVGLTATPGRVNEEEFNGLVQLFDGLTIQIQDSNGKAISSPVNHLQELGYLAKINFDTLPTGITSNETTEASINEELSRHKDRNKAIVNRVKDAVDNGESVMVFACTLDHVFALYILLQAQGMVCEFVVGETLAHEREAIIKRFTHGETKVLINYDILSTGIDIPSLDHVFIARPVGSPILYSQIVGRALRGPRNGGNETNRITTVTDNLTGFGNPGYLFTSFWEKWGL